MDSYYHFMLGVYANMIGFSIIIVTSYWYVGTLINIGGACLLGTRVIVH